MAKFFRLIPKLLLVPIPIITLITACEESTTEPPPPQGGVDSTELIREVIADPQECAACHPNHFQEWRSSMHAYAMIDPVFFTLNDIGQDRSNNQLDQFCTKCHSPFGSILGETPPGFDPADLTTIATEGIHCDVCHTMKTDNLTTGTGIDGFHLDRVRRGPIHNPQENTFHESEFDRTYLSSDICSPCHNVLSPDGSMFLETTNQEWDTSPYVAMGLECQGCHMPTYEGQAARGAPMRDNLHEHTFVGVDYPLVEFPGKNQTIQAIRELLQKAVTMQVNLPATVSADSMFNIDVLITNDQTGHDIPSGTIFERQMWIELTVEDASSSSEIFATGLLDVNSDLRNHHSGSVNNGTIPEDTALVLFNGTPFDQNGDTTLFFWEAHSISKHTIPPFATDTSRYTIQAPSQPANLNVSVRLRFRSFPPYFLRAFGQENLLSELIIFDMETAQRTITVSN